VARAKYGTLSAHRRRRSLAVALACAGLALAGCGVTKASSGVARLGKTSSSVAAGGTATTVPTGASAEKHFDQALKYSQCMRSRGVINFPDPNSGGGINIGSASGIDPSSPRFQSAGKACRQYFPAPHLSQAQIAQEERALLQFAACMRKNGAPDYPDPKFAANGAVTEGGPDPNLPDLQAASKACGG
jgi:hypothetical protein